MNNELVIADRNEQIPQEEGFAPEPSKVKPSRVPNDGKFVLPNYLTFSAVVNQVSRSYLNNADEARRHSYANALAMQRDPIYIGSLQARYLPTVQMGWHIAAENLNDTRQQASAKKVEKLVGRTPHFQQMLLSLSDAVNYGKWGVNVVWRWDWVDGTQGVRVDNWNPVNGDKFVLRWGGQVGVLVNPLYKGRKENTPNGQAHFLSQEEREGLVLHRYKRSDADYNEPDMAGVIGGIGVRSEIYWFWFLRSQVMSFMLDYLERIGAGGLTVYYYEHGNAESLADVQVAAEEQNGAHTILFPRYRDQETGGPGIERIEPSNSGAELLKELVMKYFDAEIRRFILGQDSSVSSLQSGTGTAELHQTTLSRIIKYDACNLAETLTQDFVSVIQKYSCPPDIPPLKFVFNIDRTDSDRVVANAKTLHEMGAKIDENSMLNAAGLPIPKPGASVLVQQQPLSADQMEGVK